MDEALELGEYLPQSFANASEQAYLDFLWSAFDTNVSVRSDCPAGFRERSIVSTMDGGHYGAAMARRTKRLWTDEEKRSICFQATAAGVSVAQVARRYAVNANLIFKWLRDPRFAPEAAAGLRPPEGCPVSAGPRSCRMPGQPRLPLMRLSPTRAGSRSNLPVGSGCGLRGAMIPRLSRG